MLDQTMLDQTMEIKSAVRQFIAENVLLGVHQAAIDDATPLLTGGLIDSIGMIGLVAFLEARFQVNFAPREINARNLDTLEQIDELIRNKLASREPGAANTGQQMG
jgi:acyl carrier protein